MSSDVGVFYRISLNNLYWLVDKGAVTINRPDADTDSGETGTFSIDLNRPVRSPRESELCNEGNSVDSHRVYSSSRMSQQTEGADKENYGSRDALTRKSALLASKDLMMPNGSNRQLRRSLDLDDKPILGSVAVHWENLHPSLTPQSWVGKGDPNATDKYKEVGASVSAMCLNLSLLILQSSVCTILMR